MKLLNQCGQLLDTLFQLCRSLFLGQFLDLACEQFEPRGKSVGRALIRCRKADRFDLRGFAGNVDCKNRRTPASLRSNWPESAGAWSSIA